MVLRFEFSPPGGRKEWQKLSTKNGEFLTVMSRKEELLVDVARCYGWQGQLVLQMGEWSRRVALGSG
jgi:hypothetical protein